MSKMSEKPDVDDEWRESGKECSTCGALMWARPWWDDSPEDGGACIGTWYSCGDCGDYDSE